VELRSAVIDLAPRALLDAARLALRAARAGVVLSVECNHEEYHARRVAFLARFPGLDRATLAPYGGRKLAIDPPVYQLRYKADPPSALTPELRAEIADPATKAALVELLRAKPWAATAARMALLVACCDPTWILSDPDAEARPCVACGSPARWIAPSGEAMHPRCDALLGVL
jgi:hypothetical protein